MDKYNRIKEVLEEQGRTQTWLGKQLGVSRASVNDLCSNRSQPSLKKLNQIASILSVDVCDLLVRDREDGKGEGDPQNG